MVATTNSTGSLRAMASRNIRSVPASTPVLAPTVRSAPSAAAMPAMASPWKSRKPGVSRRLILVSFHSAYAQPSEIEYLRSVSSGAVSVSVLPSFIEPCRLLVPETKARASTSVVLPLEPCPTTAMFRMASLLYSFMNSPRTERGIERDTRGLWRQVGEKHDGAANLGRPVRPLPGNSLTRQGSSGVLRIQSEPIRFAEGGEQRLA